MPEPPKAPQAAFVFDDDGQTFEGLAQTNGTRYWFARDLMQILDYDSWTTFKNAINKAIGVCVTSGVPVAENFIQCKRKIGNRDVDDFKLTRLACCLAAMNGDPKIRSVARAQVYFAELDQIAQNLCVMQAESMDRLIVRGEISEREVSLSKIAAGAGVEFQDRFRNAGYRGMYNLDLAELKKRKGMPDLSRPLFDFMGKDELAGNLFRLSLTEGRIKKENVKGQAPLENIARDVGARVRRTMIEETGITPESLPIATDIKIVKRALKGTVKSFAQMDDLEAQRVIEAEALALMPVGPVHDIFSDCPECQAGSQTSHSGSIYCTSGSIASGGNLLHCTCDYCSSVN